MVQCVKLIESRSSNAVTPHSSDVVITVHGFLAGNRSMRLLGDSALDLGHQVIHWSYPSLRGSIISHGARLSRLLSDLAPRPQVRKIHLITHSMGGIIARTAILQSRLESRWADKCGQIVMLAPPNSGSRLTRLPLGPLTARFPQIQELSESPDSYVRGLPSLRRMKAGIIAAARDLVVSPESTHLEGQHDHAVVATTHQRLTRHPEALRMTANFLHSMQLRTEPSTPGLHVHGLNGNQRRRVHSAAA
ncbi:esterase/lipase family protein [Neorhodopirellula lusitana]|uniref:esterase/lipase family protein n=1 Tax=Neorhodopirellula lusitana TaxID=445327 RepID=UPI0038510EB4